VTVIFRVLTSQARKNRARRLTFHAVTYKTAPAIDFLGAHHIGLRRGRENREYKHREKCRSPVFI
jgi:hypothetical protein